MVNIFEHADNPLTTLEDIHELVECSHIQQRPPKIDFYSMILYFSRSHSDNEH